LLRLRCYGSFRVLVAAGGPDQALVAFSRAVAQRLHAVGAGFVLVDISARFLGFGLGDRDGSAQDRQQKKSLHWKLHVGWKKRSCHSRFPDWTTCKLLRPATARGAARNCLADRLNSHERAARTFPARRGPPPRTRSAGPA